MTLFINTHDHDGACGDCSVGSTIPILIVMTGFIYATSVFRVARSLGQDVMVSDFVEAAKVRGKGFGGSSPGKSFQMSLCPWPPISD